MHTRDIGRERPKALLIGKREKDLLQNQTSAITHISILACVCVGGGWGGGGIYVHSHLCIYCYLLSFFLDVYLVHKRAP